MCHVCKYMPLAEKRANLSIDFKDSEISCCFYSFRKLKSNKFGGTLSVAGYSDPQRDPLDSQLGKHKKSKMSDIRVVTPARFSYN